MAQIYKTMADGTVMTTKIPDPYVKGRGVRYRARTVGIKFIGDFTNILDEKKAKTDIIKFLDFLKILDKRFYSSQTLTVKNNIGGRGYARPMVVKDIARIIGKSTRTANYLLAWLKEKDLVRRGKDDTLIVNPDKIMISTRLSANEYMTYKDTLEEPISKKSEYLLTMEYLR